MPQEQMSSGFSIDNSATMHLDTKTMMCEIVRNEQLVCWILQWTRITFFSTDLIPQNELAAAELTVHAKPLIRAWAKYRTKKVEYAIRVFVVKLPHGARIKLCFARARIKPTARVSFYLNVGLESLGLKRSEALP